MVRQKAGFAWVVLGSLWPVVVLPMAPWCPKDGMVPWGNCRHFPERALRGVMRHR